MMVSFLALCSPRSRLYMSLNFPSKHLLTYLSERGIQHHLCFAMLCLHCACNPLLEKFAFSSLCNLERDGAMKRSYTLGEEAFLNGNSQILNFWQFPLPFHVNSLTQLTCIFLTQLYDGLRITIFTKHRRRSSYSFIFTLKKSLHLCPKQNKIHSKSKDA